MASSFAATDLHRQLQERGIQTLVICGLMTHMCVSTAAHDIDGWDGNGIVGHAVLHRAALTAIADSFGEVLHAARIVELGVR